MSKFNVRLPHWGGWTVPNSRTRDREIPVARLSVCSWNSEDVVSVYLSLCMCLRLSHCVSVFVCLSVSGNTSKTCTVSSVTRSRTQSPRDHHSQPLVRRCTASPELVDVVTSTGHVQYCTVCSLYAFVLLIALCFCWSEGWVDFHVPFLLCYTGRRLVISTEVGRL